MSTCSDVGPVRIGSSCEWTGRRSPSRTEETHPPCPDCTRRSRRPCPSTRPSRSSPTSPTPSTGTPASPPPSASTPGPVGLGARYRLGVRMRGRVAPMEYRITTYEPPSRVVLTGEGSNVSAVDEIRFEPRPTARHPHRLHRRHPSRRLDAARRAVRRRRVREDRQGRARRDAAGARRSRAGGRPMRVAVVGVGRQRPDRRLCPAPGRARRRALRAGGRARRPRRHGDRGDADRPGQRGHRVHRLQRADLSAPGRPVRGARRRDPAERHVVRVRLPGVRRRVRVARRRAASSPSGASLARPSYLRMFPDIAPLLPRCAGDPRRPHRRPG